MTEILRKSAAAGTALVFCKDGSTRRLILDSLRPLAILPEICEHASLAASLLDKQKFEAVIVDMQLGEESLRVLRGLRLSRANRTAVTFAITTGSEAQTPGRSDSTFVLQRPLSAAAINQTLRAAFGLVVRERRRYFRCAVAIPAFVRVRHREDLQCQIVNISEGGIRISVPTPLDSNSALLRFSLPGEANQLFAETDVVWCGHGGLVGLRFQSLATPQKSELQEWLARKLDATLPENVAALFRSVGESQT
jgi:hypothetical protein